MSSDTQLGFVYLWLSRNLVHRQGWPQTHRNLPASAFQALGEIKGICYYIQLTHFLWDGSLRANRGCLLVFLFLAFYLMEQCTQLQERIQSKQCHCSSSHTPWKVTNTYQERGFNNSQKYNAHIIITKFSHSWQNDWLRIQILFIRKCFQFAYLAVSWNRDISWKAWRTYNV